MPLGLGNTEGIRHYTLSALALPTTEPLPKQELLARLDTFMNTVDKDETLAVTIKRVE